MAQINCHLPIKLRIVGELSDTQLEQLGQTLVRILRARLALAERTIAARYKLADWAGDSAIREAYDPAYAEAAGASYQLPAYDRQGQRVSMRLQEKAPKGMRPWIIRKAINFRARVGEFLYFVEGLDPSRTLEDKVLYIDIFDQLRWVSLWLVQVNQDYTLTALEEALFARALALSRVRDNQILAYGLGTTETMRQQLIEIDEERRVRSEIPELTTRNRGRVAGAGPYSEVYTGGWVLFASMVLPKIELSDVATPGLEIQVALKLRELDFLVPAPRFEENFGLPWLTYVQEWGNSPVTLRLQPVTVVKKVHQLALEYLTEQMVRQALRNAQGTLATTDTYFGRLFVLNRTALDKFPPAARAQVDRLTNDATRNLADVTVAGDLSPNWEAVFAFTIFTVDEESIGAARYHPEARRLLPLLLAKLSGDEGDDEWQQALLRFLRDTFGSTPPTTRPDGGSVFEYLLVELETHGQLSMLFDKVEASGHFGLLHLLVQLALSTSYATHQRVQQAYQRLNQRYNTGWEHTYRIKEQEIWLKHDAGQVVRRGDIIAAANSIYSVVKDEKRLKEASIPKMRKALEAEGQELLKRILLGQDQKQYSDEEFALAAFNEVRKNAQKYNISNSDFETVTIERSARLLGIEVRVEEALERIYVTYEFVERVEGKPWSTAETVPNSRRTQFIGSFHGAVGEGFEQMLWFWEYNKAAVVVEYFAIGVSALAVIAVAWEVGLVAGAVELAGGWTVVGISIGISELFYAYRIIFKGEEFTWRGFFTAALDGYLAALTFRGAGWLGRGLAGRIGTDSITNLVIGWIGEKLTVGIVGGASTAAVITFSHDLINIATGTGGWSSASDYLEHMADGAVFGVLIELFVGAAGPLARVSGRTALETGSEVIQAIREGRLSGLRWMIEATEALGNMRRALANALESGSTENVVNAFRERIVRITQGVSNEYRLALFRRLLDLNPAALTRQSLDGLERLLTASRGELSNESVLALLNSLNTNQLRNLLEAMGGLENSVVRTLARTNQLAALVTTDLQIARAAYAGQAVALIQIAAKLRAQGLGGRLAVIDGVAQQSRIQGFRDWIAESAGREATRMIDKVNELAEAQRLFQAHRHEADVIVRIGQDARTAGRSFDITVERQLPGGGTEVLRHTEVYTPEAAIERGRNLISGIAHAAEKIPKGVRDGSVPVPTGAQEGTIAVQWPPPAARLGGDAEIVFDTHGNYTRRSLADPTVTRGRGGNLLDDAIGELNRRVYDNPVEFVRRLTVIDQNGRAIFELINTTPGVRPARWTWRDLQVP